MLYLENVLSSMKDNADVRVKLSSHTVYCINEEEDLVMVDGCGNHHASNWIKAINDTRLTGVFEVSNISATFEYYMSQPQWEITLVNEKSKATELLGYYSNRAAIEASGLYF